MSVLFLLMDCSRFKKRYTSRGFQKPFTLFLFWRFYDVSREKVAA